MSLLRRLVLPAAIGSVSTVWSIGLAFGVRPEFPIAMPEYLFGLFLNFIGLAGIGWPAVDLMRRFAVPRAVAAPLLVAIGALGGGAFALAVTWSPLAAALGLAPGGSTALIWVLFNLDLLSPRSSGALDA